MHVGPVLSVRGGILVPPPSSAVSRNSEDHGAQVVLGRCRTEPDLTIDESVYEFGHEITWSIPADVRGRSLDSTVRHPDLPGKDGRRLSCGGDRRWGRRRPADA